MNETAGSRHGMLLACYMPERPTVSVGWLPGFMCQYAFAELLSPDTAALRRSSSP